MPANLDRVFFYLLWILQHTFCDTIPFILTYLPIYLLDILYYTFPLYHFVHFYLDICCIYSIQFREDWRLCVALFYFIPILLCWRFHLYRFIYSADWMAWPGALLPPRIPLQAHFPNTLHWFCLICVWFVPPRTFYFVLGILWMRFIPVLPINPIWHMRWHVWHLYIPNTGDSFPGCILDDVTF